MNSIFHGNYIVDRGKSWKNHGIVFLNSCGNPDKLSVKQSDTQLFPNLLHIFNHFLFIHGCR